MTSEASARARALIAERLPEARGLGRALADLIDDPESFVAVLRDGLVRLADDEYAAEHARFAAGSGNAIAVRWPLIEAIAGQLRQPLQESSPSSALWLAQRLAAADEREMRLLGHVPLARSLPDDPERSWQLMRRLARAAGDSIAVDSLAELYAQGILREPFRWAELEQLVYSNDRWERRLVGSTVARLPEQLPAHRRNELRRLPALALIGSLLGDSDEQVQEALAWALREWTKIDAPGVAALLREETALAASHDDGHRASVIRQALPAVPAHAAELRTILRDVRPSTGAASTSTAASVAAAFAAGDGWGSMSERAVALQGERQRRAGGAG